MYLKGEKNFKKDVMTVQLQVMFACLYHMKYNSFLSCADPQQAMFVLFFPFPTFYHF